MRISDLQTKKIISLQTGRNIGNIIDVEINSEGKIESLIVEENKGFFTLNRESDVRIKWVDITKIGEDVILVKKE